MDLPEFEVAKGAYFTVIMFDDYVIKVPTQEETKQEERLEEIAALQTEIAAKIPGVLPCCKVGPVLIMPRAPGVRVDLLPNKTRRRANALRDRKLEEIRRIGYDLDGGGNFNIHYDVDADEIYLLDFHTVRKIR